MMTIRLKWVLLLLVGTVFDTSVEAQVHSLPAAAKESKKISAVVKAYSRLDSFMVDANTDQLQYLLHDQLTLGHSNGLIESKTDMLQHLANGYLKYHRIEDLGHQELQFVDNVAILRRQIKVSGALNGTTFTVSLKVLETWIFEHKQWKLLSRQSVKKV